jgi:outer membrane protein assembly factor BamB
LKVKITFLVLSSLALALLLSGCATGLTPSSWPGIASDGNAAFVASAGAVYAVDLQNGSELWRFPEKTDAKKTFFAAPVLTPDGQLIVGDYANILYSLDPQNGQVNWQFDAARDRWIGGVLVANDLIYAPNADYDLYALDLRGQLQWKFETKQALWSAPVTDGARIYFGSLDRKVYAVNARSGQPAWEKELAGAIVASPVLGEDGRLYVNTFGGVVYALDAASGNELWQYSAGSFVWCAPLFAEGEVFFGDETGIFYALDAATGVKDWNVQPNSPILGAPLAVGGNVLFGDEAGDLYALDAQGRSLWTLTVNGKLYGAPVTAGDLILVAPVEGQSLLIALDQAGVQKWSFAPVKK